MVGFKVDINKPRYKVGDIFRCVNKYTGLCIRDNINIDELYKIVEFRESMVHKNEYVYVMVKCSKNGKLYKKEHAFFQSSMEYDFCNGVFQRV